MRYSRQEYIEDWQQNKLTEAKIAVIGNTLSAYFIAADLIAMGFGKVTKIGDRSLPFLDISKLNNTVKLTQIPGIIINESIAEDYIGDQDFIIDTSKDLTEKISCFKYARKKSIPIVSVATTDSAYSIKFNSPKIEDLLKFHKEDLDQQDDGIVNPIIAGGIVVDEVRKRIMPLEKDAEITESRVRNNEEKVKKRVLQVGAGAIGTFSGIAIALYGSELTVVDFDTVEESNLNRQILFYDAIGRKKAEVMAERLSTISEVSGLVEKIKKGSEIKGDYDVILSCVDNSEARIYLEGMAKKSNLPLINAGSSISSGIVMPSVSGKTACLDCQTFGRLKGSINESRKNGNCYDPAIIISNQIVGGIQAGRVNKTLNGKYSTIKYISGCGIKVICTLETCFEKCENAFA